MHTISIITAGRLPRGDGGRGRDGLVLGKQRVRTIRTGKRNSRLSIDLSYQYFSISLSKSLSTFKFGPGETTSSRLLGQVF